MNTLTTAETMKFCDTVKLSDFNQSQPYGVLLTLDKDLHVIQYSENAPNLLETPVQELLSQKISHFLKAESVEKDIITYLYQTTDRYQKMIWQSQENKIQILVYIYQDPEQIILEIERTIQNNIEDKTLSELTQNILADMKNTMNCQNIQELAQTVCAKVQTITDYDRVIIYKFDDYDYSGTVIGEALNNGMESYLGLRFPANDIPQSVRATYLKHPLRYIPTILEQPINIVPEINPITGNYLDLSNVNLRMVAPVHVQYMINMKVVSATSVAIIQDNKLWGLIACHHKHAKFLSLNLRLILLLIANTLATQSFALECKLDVCDERKTVELQTILNNDFNKTHSLSDALDCYYHKLMELVSATGMSVYFQKILLNYGDTPTNEQIIDLMEWLNKNQQSTIYATSTLPLEYEKSIYYKNTACGLLAVRITAIENHYILFYKPERIATVIWAGNPDESLKCSQSTYSPRDSFERFLQTISNHSSPWANHKIKSADFIRSIVVNKQLNDLLQAQVMTDPLTNLLNRLYLEQRLALEVQRASRDHQALTIVLIDLDFFKKINDNFGHQAGDLVLIEFSKLLKNHFRGYDYIYRYGGEEFLIVLPGMNVSAAKQKADSLRNETKNLNIKFNGLKLPQISISLGISSYPQHGSSGGALITSADVALYQAKKNGRNQVIVAS